jgi:hypothetical protein
MVFLLPLTSHVCRPPFSATPTSSLLFIGIFFGVQRMAAQFCFTSVFVMINNSCKSDRRATANGIGQTFVSIGRLVGPLAGANIFAWSTTKGAEIGYPLDYHLLWYLVSGLCLMQYAVCATLPLSIDRALGAQAQTTAESSGGHRASLTWKPGQKMGLELKAQAALGSASVLKELGDSAL